MSFPETGASAPLSPCVLNVQHLSALDGIFPSMAVFSQGADAGGAARNRAARDVSMRHDRTGYC